jgi:Ni/Co efflux regulator RcnB
MRNLLVTTAMVSMAIASGATAQERVVVRGPAPAATTPAAATPAPTRPVATPRPVSAPQPQNGRTWTTTTATPSAGNWQRPQRPAGWNNGRPGANGPRWGGRIQGRWWGGARAPGGWGAYHRPVRGWTLPSYWIAPRWYVNDWAGYGLPQPPVGYTWSRYYNDAVLIDDRGAVYDTIGGIDWDQYDPEGVDYTFYDDGNLPGYSGYTSSPPPPARAGAPYDYPRESNGVAGAAVGAAIGGVAGAAIAGRGDRLGGALIGGGVGALTGYAVDKSADRGRRAPPPPPPPPAYGAGYPMPAVGTRAPSPPPAYGPGSAPMPAIGTRAPSAPAPIVTAGPGTTVVTTTTTSGPQATPGYYANGYYYPGTSVTTVTVQSQPTVTTTTTETWDDAVTYTRSRRGAR